MLDTNQLKSALQTLDSVSPSKTTSPILKYLLFKTNKDKLEITATDTEKTLTVFIDYDGDELDACVPSKELKDIVATVRESTIRFKQTDKSFLLYDGNHRTRFNYLRSTEFPSILIPENKFTLDGGILQSSLTKAYIACSEDRSHPILTGININSVDGNLVVQSSDGFRATYIKMMLGTHDFDMTIEKPDRKIIALLNGQIEVSVSDRKCAFSGNGFIYSCSLIGGNYPTIYRIIPQTKNITVEIEKQKLNNAVKRAMVFAKNTANVISFKLDGGQLSVFSSDDTGENSMSFDVSTTDDIEFSVNGKYVLDFLSVCGEKIIIELLTPVNPITLKSVSNETFTHVIMPMHLGKQ